MNKEIEKLTKEREVNTEKLAGYERKKEQLEHQIEREENRQTYINKKDRDHRTHHLCNLGGTVEHFFPVTKALTREEMYSVFEELSELPGVQTFFRLVHPKNGGEDLSHSTTSMLTK